MNGNQEQKKVVLIDNNAKIAELITYAILLQGKYQITVATNGEQGIELVYEEQPDCIIIDRDILLKDGMHVLHGVRTHTASITVPVILLSALGEEEDCKSGLLGQADSYLSMPFLPHDLYTTIDYAIGI